MLIAFTFSIGPMSVVCDVSFVVLLALLCFIVDVRLLASVVVVYCCGLFV